MSSINHQIFLAGWTLFVTVVVPSWVGAGSIGTIGMLGANVVVVLTVVFVVAVEGWLLGGGTTEV